MPDFVLYPGQEHQKAKEFMNEVGKLFELAKLAGEDSGSVAYKFLDNFFDWITVDTRDFGYMVSYWSEDTPLIEDIFVDAGYANYRKMVDQPSLVDQDDLGFMTKEQAAMAFWNVLAKQITLSFPMHDMDKAKLHIESAVAGMFTGANRHNLHFHLYYVEKDQQSETYYRTSELGDLLIANTLANYGF